MFKKLIYLVLSAYLENFKPCGYFLKIKKTQGSLRLLREVSSHQGRFFDSKSSNPENFVLHIFQNVVLVRVATKSRKFRKNDKIQEKIGFFENCQKIWYKHAFSKNDKDALKV